MTDLSSYIAERLAAMSVLTATLCLVAITGGLGVVWLWVITEVRRVMKCVDRS